MVETNECSGGYFPTGRRTDCSCRGWEACQCRRLQQGHSMNRSDMREVATHTAGALDTSGD